MDNNLLKNLPVDLNDIIYKEVHKLYIKEIIKQIPGKALWFKIRKIHNYPITYLYYIDLYQR